MCFRDFHVQRLKVPKGGLYCVIETELKFTIRVPQLTLKIASHDKCLREFRCAAARLETTDLAMTRLRLSELM